MTNTLDNTTTEPGRGMRFTGWAANYVDERTSASTAVKTLGRKIFPDHCQARGVCTRVSIGRHCDCG